jgi:bifunctional non-homologous end joining protein LigD
MRAGEHRIGGRTVEVTSVERVLFPDDGITKGDVVQWYADIAEVVVPHIRGRPLTLQRFPQGIGEEGFYQKEAGEHFPSWIETVEVPRRGGGTVHHVTCDEPADLVYLANQGTLTFHVWLSQVGRLDVPDLIVFDLDPPEGVDIADLRWAVRRVRDALDQRGLEPFLQATGSKGYHVVAPIEPGPTADEVRAWARAVAEVLADEDPARLTTEHRKAKREGRIYLDTARNTYAQTFVMPYTIRPRTGAPVATPLDWDELSRAEPASYTLRNIRRRVAQKDDPWAGMRRARRRIPL